jgi:cyclopropane-fatty-acyl-phospholipid synthase
LGRPSTVEVVAYDASRAGPSESSATVRFASPLALTHLARHPGELGFVRAYVDGAIDVEGDLHAVIDLAFRSNLHLRVSNALRLAAAAAPHIARRAGAPPEEARLGGRLHSKRRDAAAVVHHYDVSNDFYRLLLGPSLTYSCAVYQRPDQPLADAQANKYDLICRKLDLRPGMRLLDVGCGWGGMALHAAVHYGVDVVGITLSPAQHELATARIAAAGLTGRAEIRIQDYRDVSDGPYDAISSIGMVEHVGRANLDAYCGRLHRLLTPGGRLLNHGINRQAVRAGPGVAGRATLVVRRVATAAGSRRTSRIDSPLMQRYIFPDGELHELGTLVSTLQQNGLEIAHVEGFRAHYALTLRAWEQNLTAGWDRAVADVGERRVRIWRLYLVACALAFEHGSTEIHQILAVKPHHTAKPPPLDWIPTGDVGPAT